MSNNITFNFSTLPPLLIEKIFEKLPDRELGICLQVSRIWNECAFNTMKKNAISEIKTDLLKNIIDTSHNKTQELRSKIQILAKNSSFDLAIELANSISQISDDPLDPQKAIRDITYEYFLQLRSVEGIELTKMLSNINILESSLLGYIRALLKHKENDLAIDCIELFGRPFYVFSVAFIYLNLLKDNLEAARIFMKKHHSFLNKEKNTLFYKLFENKVITILCRSKINLNRSIQEIETLYESYLEFNNLL